MKRTVISLGGSILVRNEDDPRFIDGFREILRSFPEDHRFIIITGGGRTARDYIKIGRELGSDEATLDWVGIGATRLNAWLVISSLGKDCYPRPVETLEEAIQASSSHRFVIGGGTHPGHTTDTVAALIAERWNADSFLNLTAVNGAYTSDPNKDADARKIDTMTSWELMDLVSGTITGAGSHSVMDPVASKIIHRASLKTFILNGRDLEAVTRCLNGSDFDGTVITHEEGG
jgi:uridylate kinase